MRGPRAASKAHVQLTSVPDVGENRDLLLEVNRGSGGGAVVLNINIVARARVTDIPGIREAIRSVGSSHTKKAARQYYVQPLLICVVSTGHDSQRGG